MAILILHDKKTMENSTGGKFDITKVSQNALQMLHKRSLKAIILSDVRKLTKEVKN